MASYLVRTPGNPDYAGKVYGIPFASGRAVVSKDTLDPKLKWTVEQIVFSMKNDFGYEILELAPPSTEPVEQPTNTTPIPPAAVRAEADKGVPVLVEIAEEPPAEPPAEKTKRNVNAALGAEGTKGKRKSE